jgi:arginase
MHIDILTMPYDSGHRNQRMGSGPLHLVEHGLGALLERTGHAVQVAAIETDDEFPTEISTSFELCGRLAERVQQSVSDGHLPLALAGNCNSATGAVAGLGPESVGLIWFDGHADFNTPETTTSGFLDGMGLAITTGRCWQRLAAKIPGFRPLPDAHVVHVGMRDVSERERRALADSQIKVVDAAQIRQVGLERALLPALAALRTRVQRCYVHLDLDVIDARVAPANEYAREHGLAPAQVGQALALIQERLTIAGAGVASYDPRCDSDDRLQRIAFGLIEQLVNPAQERTV